MTTAEVVALATASGSHAVPSSVRVITLMAADERYEQTEGQGLDESFDDVRHEDAAFYAVKIGAFVDAEQHYAGQVAADDADHVEDGGQKRKGDQRGEETGATR